MQIRLDQKCSFGEAAVGRVGGRGQATTAKAGLWTALVREFHTADISKLMRRILRATPTAAGPSVDRQSEICKTCKTSRKADQYTSRPALIQTAGQQTADISDLETVASATEQWQQPQQLQPQQQQQQQQAQQQP